MSFSLKNNCIMSLKVNESGEIIDENYCIIDGVDFTVSFNEKGEIVNLQSGAEISVRTPYRVGTMNIIDKIKSAENKWKLERILKM